MGDGGGVVDGVFDDMFDGVVDGVFGDVFDDDMVHGVHGDGWVMV